MTERQGTILTSLVREYVRTAEPVGSEVLVGRYDLPYSSATVRAEFADLEDDGFLTHPHTSAGRVPTGLGYRYYVDAYADGRPLERAEALRLREVLLNTRQESRRLWRGTAKLLADLTRTLAVTGLTETEEFHEAGLASLLAEPEFADAERVRDLSRVVDALAEHVSDLARESIRHPRVYIGAENPYVRTPHVSMLMATCDLPTGARELLVVIGPTRMRYDRNIGLLEEFTHLLEESRGGVP